MAQKNISYCTIDIVLTNPPYVPLADIPEQPEARDYDPDLALYGVFL